MPRATAQTRRNGKTSDTQSDLYTRVTGQILADLAQGVRPWTRPWASAHPAGSVRRPLRHNLIPYSGINTVLLWARAMAQGYGAPIWMTFRQAIELGGCVRRGERATTIVYANRLSRTEAGEDGHDVERSIPFLKAYGVFNIEQIDGLPESFAPAPVDPLPQSARVAHAETFFQALGADVAHAGDQAWYAPGPDRIQMPPFEAFQSGEDYYATLAHECVHWTRHPSRLDRDLGRKAAGDAGYAREELVAELGAAFLCADLGLELTPRPDHAAYIGAWLKVLEADKRAIFSAAAHAQRAVDYLKDLQPEA
ncbi:MAG: antirestriction protein [Caulobacter sp. 12-67-6]|nr:MAG: antirestriction protein [Caulobacter sp. 12-67-6]OYX74259.1 MAG: antirestriction protein [Caulobacter sp. 32-67-35]